MDNKITDEQLCGARIKLAGKEDNNNSKDFQFEYNNQNYNINDLIVLDDTAKTSDNFETDIATHDTTLYFITQQFMRCVNKILIKNLDVIASGKKIHFAITKSKIIETNCTLKNDDRPIYVKYLVQVNYFIE